jgi:hypothetical protein
MAAHSYYKMMQFFTRDAEGYCEPLAGETIEIRLDADNSLITSETTDEAGFIYGGFLASVPDLTLVRLVSATYATYALQTTGADEETVFSLNPEVSFIADDQFADTSEPESVALYLEDEDAPEATVRYIGSAAPGTIVKIPFESAYARNLKIYAVPHGASVGRGEDGFKNFSPESLSTPPVRSNPVRTVTANTYAEEADGTIVCDTTSNDITVTLLSALSEGKIIHLKNIGANNMVVATEGGETIDGSSSDLEIVQWDAVTVQKTDAGDFIIL